MPILVHNIFKKIVALEILIFFLKNEMQYFQPLKSGVLFH